jgi:hypothetical protein
MNAIVIVATGASENGVEGLLRPARRVDGRGGREAQQGFNRPLPGAYSPS